MSCRRGEECRSLPWCQHSVRAGRGRDGTARAAAVTPRRCPVLRHTRRAWLRARLSQDTQWQCFERRLGLWERFLLAATPGFRVPSCAHRQQGDSAGHTGVASRRLSLTLHSAQPLAEGRHAMVGSDYLSAP